MAAVLGYACPGRVETLIGWEGEEGVEEAGDWEKEDLGWPLVRL